MESWIANGLINERLKKLIAECDPAERAAVHFGLLLSAMMFAQAANSEVLKGMNESNQIKPEPGSFLVMALGEIRVLLREIKQDPEAVAATSPKLRQISEHIVKWAEDFQAAGSSIMDLVELFITPSDKKLN